MHVDGLMEIVERIVGDPCIDTELPDEEWLAVFHCRAWLAMNGQSHRGDRFQDNRDPESCPVRQAAISP